MLLRDKLRAHLSQMGDHPDYQRLASDVLGIRGASQDIARRLVAQALVIEDRGDRWRRLGERICADAPEQPGVYVLRDQNNGVLYVGKAVNVRHRLRTHFAKRRWRFVKPELSRASSAEWHVVGSELEALLREASLIAELQPIVNVQTQAPSVAVAANGRPGGKGRRVPSALVRDVIVILPSVEADSVELVAARATGEWLIQRTRRDGADLAVHTTRLMKFFRSRSEPDALALAPLVFSWLAYRGARATRLDPHEVASPRELRGRLDAILRDARLFDERIVQRGRLENSFRPRRGP